MSFYENMRDNVATKLIQKRGDTHTFTRKIRGEYDPLSGSSTDTSKTYTAMAVKTEFSAYERNDSSIQVDDIKLLAEVADTEYNQGDEINIDGANYELIKVTAIKPGPVVVAYKLQARK